MLDTGPDAVEPATLIGAARGREGRARELLGIEPVGRPLRRVAALGQRTRQRLGFEVVTEAGHVGISHFTHPAIADIGYRRNCRKCNYQCSLRLPTTISSRSKRFCPTGSTASPKTSVAISPGSTTTSASPGPNGGCWRRW